MEPPQVRDANCNLMKSIFPVFFSTKKERGLRATNISHTTLMGSLVPTSREMERETQVPADIFQKSSGSKSSDTELPKGNFSFLVYFHNWHETI